MKYSVSEIICVIRDMLSSLELTQGCSRQWGGTLAYSFTLKLNFSFLAKAKTPDVETKFTSPWELNQLISSDHKEIPQHSPLSAFSVSLCFGSSIGSTSCSLLSVWCVVSMNICVWYLCSLSSCPPLACPHFPFPPVELLLICCIWYLSVPHHSSLLKRDFWCLQFYS